MSKSVELLRSAPTQARSREALERFITAGEQLLSENKFEQVGISELSSLAKSSVGTFYRLFEDKEVLFRLLHERFVKETKALLDDALDPDRWQEGSVEDILRTLIQAMGTLYANKEGLLRALIIRSSSDVGFRQGLHDLNRHISEKLTPLLVSRKDEIGHRYPDLAIKFGLNVVLGTMNHQTLAGISLMKTEDLVAELADVLFCYLRTEPHVSA